MGEEAVKIMQASQAGSANDFKRKKKPKGIVTTLWWQLFVQQR